MGPVGACPEAQGAHLWDSPAPDRQWLFSGPAPTHLLSYDAVTVGRSYDAVTVGLD